MAYILEAHNLTKYFGSNLLFNNLDLYLDKSEKAGLIGANGVGKTTLMNCLMGKEIIDQGTVHIERLSSIGYLEQIPVYAENTSLLGLVLEVFADIFEQREKLRELELLMSQEEGKTLEDIMRRYGNLRETYEREGGFTCEAQTRKVLSGLGFKEDDYQRPFASFSGGEKTRISLARLLVRDHDILFLDEPTNHLDLDSIEWLENYLKNYPGALLIISHDRYFLDQVTKTTFNMEAQGLKRYKGNYSGFLEQKALEDEAQLRSYEKQQQEIKDTEEYIRRNKAGIKSKQARGRQTRLAKLERIEQPFSSRDFSMGKADISSRTGDKVLYLDKLYFNFGNRQLLSGIEQEIHYQERVALLGPNGMGKTTLLKLILGQLQPQEGSVRYGSRVKVAYFDQEHSNLNIENDVLSEIIDNYDLNLEEAKSLLARFLFFADDLQKKVKSLSGGEQGRLSLLKLTLEKGNFLIMDEPTNHLDISSRETIEDYLQGYPGTILMVSHDRYFVDAVATRVLELDNGQITSYIGDYTDYKEKKVALSELEKQSNQIDHLEETKNKKVIQSNLSKSRSQERVIRAMLREQLQKLEQEIEDLENQFTHVSELLADPQTYQNTEAELHQNLTKQLKDIEDRLPNAYKEWEDLAMKMEES